MPPIDFSRRTALYRLFDEAGALLYVGIAFDPEERWRQHRIEQPWWHEVAHKTVEWVATRTLACHAESVAIECERPRYNRSGSVLPAADVFGSRNPNPVTPTMVRTHLADIVDRARDQGISAAVVQRGRPRAFVVPVPFFERAERDAALIERLRAQNPELLDELSADLVSISVPSKLSAAG